MPTKKLQRPKTNSLSPHKSATSNRSAATGALAFPAAPQMPRPPRTTAWRSPPSRPRSGLRYHHQNQTLLAVANVSQPREHRATLLRDTIRIRPNTPKTTNDEVNRRGANRWSTSRVGPNKLPMAKPFFFEIKVKIKWNTFNDVRCEVKTRYTIKKRKTSPISRNDLQLESRSNQNKTQYSWIKRSTCGCSCHFQETAQENRISLFGHPVPR